MVIDRLRGTDPLSNLQNTQKSQYKGGVKPAPDSINISDEAKEMAEAYYASEVAASTPDVRADRIAEVKEKIKNPAYINQAVLNTVADRIMDAFGI